MSASAGPTRLVIVSEDGLYRDLLAHTLAQMSGLQVIGVLAGAREALLAVPALGADVVLLDTPLGGAVDGVQLALALRQWRPALGIVLLGARADLSGVPVLAPENLPGWVYLVKGSVPDLGTLERAIQQADDGLVALDGGVLPQLAARRPEALAELSGRERELLALIASGLANAAISRRFRLADKTIENMVSTLYQRLDIHRLRDAFHPRVAATLLYLRVSAGRPRS